MVDQNMWKIKIGAFFHDPPDKALKIDGHRERASELLLQLLDTPLGTDEQKIVEMADHVASAMQRINIPEEIEHKWIDFARIGVQPNIHHTLSGKSERPIITSRIESMGVNMYLISTRLLGKIIRFKDADTRVMFLRVWRLLPEEEPLYADLPADTRIPDHTIWDHLDATSGIVSSLHDGLAFLSFKLTPVQEFIEHSRKTADLWAGSHILSYLSFNAMLPIVEEIGPDAIIFPYLRGQPFLDHWLVSKGITVNSFSNESLQISNIPHRFLAIVPASQSEYFECQVKKRLEETWEDIAKFTKKELLSLLPEGSFDNFLDETWSRQVRNAFKTYTATIRWVHPPESKEAVEDWLRKSKGVFPADLVEKYDRWMEWYRREGKYNANTGVLYGLYYEIVGYLVDQKSKLFEGEDEPSVKSHEGAKCTICGIRNQIRPQNENATNFWKQIRQATHSRNMSELLKENERLCTVCLIKRFYRRYAKEKLSLSKEILSVASVASSKFRNICIEKAESEIIEFMKVYHKIRSGRELGEELSEELLEEFKDKNALDGEWLFSESYTEQYLREYGHSPGEDELKKIRDRLGDLYKKAELRPSNYYAILVMDGDRMGMKLLGECLPNLANFLHENVRAELEKHNDLRRMIERPRILNPKVHVAISRSLKDFSTTIINKVVKDYDGVLIYSGGDDVLALLPPNHALNVAFELNSKFGSDFIEWNGKRLGMLGNGSTMSAGIVFAHYKYPLHDALSKAREAIHSAKEEYGRGAFVLTSIKHSGQSISAGAKWDTVKDLQKIVKALIEKMVSPRFIYELLSESETLESIGKIDVVESETRRILRQHSTNKATDGYINQLTEAIVKIYNSLSKLGTIRGKALQHVANLVKLLLDAERGS